MQHFRRGSDAAVLDLRNVNHAVDAVGDVGERAERGQADHGRFADGAHRKVALEDLPGIVFHALVAERDAVILFVKRLDVDLDFVALLDHFAGVLDALPGKLRDMDHAVYAAEVHKCAVGGERFHRAGVFLAFFDLVPEGFVRGFSFFTQDGADGTDRALLLLVHVDDAELHGLLDKLAELCVTRQTGERAGNEHAHAFGVDQNAALDSVRDHAFDHLFVVLRFGDLIPGRFRVIAALGEHHSAFGIVGLHDDELQFVADLQLFFRVGRRIVAVFLDRNEASIFSADIYLYFIRCNTYNNASHFLVRAHRFEILFQRILPIDFFGFGFVFVDDFGHGKKYLLYNTCRRGRTCCYPNGPAAGKVDLPQFRCPLDQIGRAKRFAHLPQLFGV